LALKLYKFSVRVRHMLQKAGNSTPSNEGPSTHWSSTVTGLREPKAPRRRMNLVIAIKLKADQPVMALQEGGPCDRKHSRQRGSQINSVPDTGQDEVKEETLRVVAMLRDHLGSTGAREVPSGSPSCAVLLDYRAGVPCKTSYLLAAFAYPSSVVLR